MSFFMKGVDISNLSLVAMQTDTMIVLQSHQWWHSLLQSIQKMLVITQVNSIKWKSTSLNIMQSEVDGD